MGQKVLGLDIRANGIRAVMASRELKGCRILESSRIELTADNDLETGLKQVRDALAKRIETREIPCCVSVPAEEIAFRNLKVPLKTPRKIAQILPLEVAPTLAFETADLALDFNIIPNGSGRAASASQAPERDDESPQPNDTKGHLAGTAIWAAVASGERLKDYLEPLAAAGFTTETVTFGGACAVQYLARYGERLETAVVLDLDQDKATLFLLADGQVQMVRVFQVAAENASAIETLAFYIRYTSKAFTDTTGHVFDPDRVVMTGWRGETTQWEKPLAEALGLQVTCIDLVRDVAAGRPAAVTFDEGAAEPAASSPDKDPDKGWIAGQMNNALASAVLDPRRIKLIDFRRDRFSGRKWWDTYKKRLVVPFLLLVVTLGLWLTSLYLEGRGLQNRLDGLENSIRTEFKAAFPEVKRVVDPLLQARGKIRDVRRDYAVAEQPVRSLRAVDVVKIVSSRLPPAMDIELTRLAVDPDSVFLSGHTDRFETVDEIKNRLEKVTGFESVKITTAKSEKTTKRKQFRIQIKLASE